MITTLKFSTVFFFLIYIYILFLCHRSGHTWAAWCSTCPCYGSSRRSTTCSAVPSSPRLSTLYRYVSHVPLHSPRTSKPELEWFAFAHAYYIKSLFFFSVFFLQSFCQPICHFMSHDLSKGFMQAAVSQQF